MPQLFAMRSEIADDIRAQLVKAEKLAGECDSIVIIMEKRNGGLQYFANDNATLATMNWVMDSLKAHLQAIAKDTP